MATETARIPDLASSANVSVTVPISGGARLGVVILLTATLAACTRGCVGEVEQAFCDAIDRHDAAAAKAIFDAGQINMMARDGSGDCQPGLELLEAAKPQFAVFTEMAVAFARRDGVANASWSGGSSNSSGSAARRTSGGGTTYAIEVAAQNANAAVMRSLVDAGADTTGRIAGNAVMAAANQGSLEIVRMLVDKGADPNAGMAVAVSRRQPAILEYLESKGAREEVPPLLIAARRGDLKALEASIAARVDLNAVDSQGRTALYRAAYYGHVEVVKRLAKAGANLEVMTAEDFWTALHVAANENHAAVIQALAAANANVEARRDPAYMTPLLAALMNQAPDAVKALLAAGADPNVWTDSETTAVRRAALYGHLAMTRALLAAGARVNEAHGTGWQPPLHAVVGLCGPLPANDPDNDYYRVTVMKALLAAGADRSARNAEGKTPLEVVTGLLAGTQEPFYRACHQAKIDVLRAP
jgi:ankyrin repeat protein